MPQAMPETKGSNIFEFTVAQKDLDESLRVIRARAEGKCLIGQEPLGPRVKLTVILYSDTPERDAEGILADLSRSHVELHSYQAGGADAEIEF